MVSIYGVSEGSVVLMFRVCFILCGVLLILNGWNGLWCLMWELISVLILGIVGLVMILCLFRVCGFYLFFFKN